MTIEQEILKASAELTKRGYSGERELHVLDAKKFSEKLNIVPAQHKADPILTLFGLRVIEKKYMPPDRVALIDSKGVISIFNI